MHGCIPCLLEMVPQREKQEFESLWADTKTENHFELLTLEKRQELRENRPNPIRSRPTKTVDRNPSPEISKLLEHARNCAKSVKITPGHRIRFNKKFGETSYKLKFANESWTVEINKKIIKLDLNK